SAISSGSLEQSFSSKPVLLHLLFFFLSQGSEYSLLCQFLTLRSILAKPRALDARSLASWNSSLRDRLVSTTDRLQKTKAVLSSALSQNSLSLFFRPASRNSPVDLSSIPAMSLQRKSFPDWASPPRM
uniref:Uncharacterized protein n=1 Tax=Oreochromis niloticus TaxID=8128 RepID=A0A669CTL6_ORENI